MKGTRPRAMGICTGPKAGQKLGFQTIGQASKPVQSDLNKILWQLAMATATDQPYHRIVYSAASADDSNLGTGIFEVPDKVRKYITDQIVLLVETFNEARGYRVLLQQKSAGLKTPGRS